MDRSIDFDEVADLYDLYVNVDFDVPFWPADASLRFRYSQHKFSGSHGQSELFLRSTRLHATCEVVLVSSPIAHLPALAFFLRAHASPNVCDGLKRRKR